MEDCFFFIENKELMLQFYLRIIQHCFKYISLVHKCSDIRLNVSYTQSGFIGQQPPLPLRNPINHFINYELDIFPSKFLMV
jgi:hypothetical protein